MAAAHLQSHDLKLQIQEKNLTMEDIQMPKGKVKPLTLRKSWG